MNITNGIVEGCGGMITAGTLSLGAKAGAPNSYTMNLIVDTCQAHNVYDNGIYLSSMHQADINNVRVVNDTGMPHSSIVGMKGRGSFIRFNKCYVEHTNNGYGVEGFGSISDYWNGFVSEGWSSQGCSITNCVGVDCVANGIYLDRNNTIFPRDTLIADNYFFDCGMGPSGRVPTGFLTNELGDMHAVILANDGMRVKIINNTIENSGSFGSDHGIFVGRKYLSNTVQLSGVEIRGNVLLGQKIGIYIKDADYATVSNNYGERIGAYNFHHISESGVPTLIQGLNVRNSRFLDNTLAPSGHAYVLRTKPTGLWENNIVRDNIGEVQIN